jgi:hypothetical protein
MLLLKYLKVNKYISKKYLDYLTKPGFISVLLILLQRRLEQVPELIILTNSRNFKNLKLKRKERKKEKKGTFNL